LGGHEQGWPEDAMISPVLYLVGAVLGALTAATLALVYNGKHSFAGVDFVDLLRSTPRPILLMPLAVGLIVAMVSRRLGFVMMAVPGCLLVGALLGAMGGPLLFFLTPFPGYGFFSHMGVGLLIGGAIGSMTPFLGHWLSR
jgi:hypothetical protein